MAKVFTGKVAIPGDKLEEYSKLMEQAEERRESFRRQLLELNEEVYDYLLAKYTDRTGRKHTTVIDLFIKFIYRQADVESIEEITRGMVNTHFKRWWKRKVWIRLRQTNSG